MDGRERDERTGDSWLERLPVAVVATDARGSITLWTEPAQRLYGWSAAEALGRDLVELLIAGEQGETVRALIGALDGGGDPPTCIAQVVRKDGTPISVQIFASALRGSDGRVSGRVFASSDAHRAAAPDAALRESERRQRQLTELASDYSYGVLLREDGRLELDFVTEGFTALTGFTREDLAEPDGLRRFVLPSDIPRVQAQIAHLLRGEPLHTVTRIGTKSGEPRWIENNTQPVRDESGRVVSWFGVARDVTDRWLAEAAAEEGRRRLQAVFDVAMDAICVADAERRCVEVNSAACELLGHSRGELLGREICELVADGERGRAEAIWKTLEESGRVGGTIELACKNGERKEVELRAVGAPLPGLHVLMARDLSEQRRLEERLRHAEKMEAIGRLAGGVAHDFNNLLTVVSISADALLTQPHAPDAARETLVEIRKAAARGARLTRQLLAFGRRQILRPKRLSLNTLVGGMGEMLRRLIGEDVALAIDLDPRLVEVRADPNQLEQVMLNLAANARDAMPNGGTLLIQTRNAVSRDAGGAEVAAWVVLSVTDTGCGMDEETKRHLFEPFFTTKEVGQGTGLGLASIYGIVAQTGGRIEVESEPGAGTTFRISFPAVTSEEEGDEASAALPIARGGHETILLAEDEREVRRLVGHLLRRRGYQVLEAEDGIQALELAERHRGRIDLLVTDVVMPHLSGRTLARRLRVDRPLLKVLFVSGFSADAAEPVSERDGTSLLQKPFTAEEMAGRVRELLDAPVLS